MSKVFYWFGLCCASLGLYLLYVESWKLAAAVFLMIWGHNLTEKARHEK